VAEDTDRPWKKRRDEDEEDDRPRGRRRGDDEDEEEERPRRRRRDEEEEEDWEDSGRRKKLPRETLRAIVTYQKVIIICVAIYLSLVLAQFGIPPELRIFLALVAVPVVLTAVVFVFLFATKVYTTAIGVILGFLVLIPCIGLIVLVIINQKAISILKDHGISVGFFGASSSDI
jgi:hypothetical protein